MISLDYPCNGFYTPVYINDRFVGCCDSADYCEGSAMGEYIATDESTVPLEDTAVGEATATGEAIATNGESAAGQATATDEIGYSTAYPTTTSSPSSEYVSISNRLCVKFLLLILYPKRIRQYLLR